MKPFHRFLLTVGAALAANCSAPLLAQPVNDEFADATVLTGPILTVAGSNVGATKPFGPGGEPSIPPQSIGTFGGASVWWAWTALAGGQTTIGTEGSDFNTLLGVYVGDSVNQLSLVASNDDFEGNPWSRVVFEAEAGVTYRIMVDGYRSGPGFGSPATGNIVLQVQGVGGLTIVTPTEGMIFTAGEPIPIELTIDEDFPNPPVTRVEFFLGDALIATSTEAPHMAVADHAVAGTNFVYAVAYDSSGVPIQSAIVPVFVQNIGLTLLSPLDGRIFGGTSPITVTAWGYLPAGAITNVEFFVNREKFGEDNTPPFSATWTNVAGGSHRLTAVGRSDTGESFNSQPVNIAVPRLLFASGSVWQYLDDGSDQGTAWREPGFDAGSWASGPAELGYGDGDEATVVESGPVGDVYITTYFRSVTVVSNAADYAQVIINVKRDDGAVVYINGVEAARFNMPAGEVDYLTPALNAGDDGGGFVSTAISPGLLEDGTNILAVEIHQSDSTSSDISFDLSLVGIPPVVYNDSPTIVFSPTNHQQFLEPVAVPLSATAADTDGEVVRVEFYVDGERVGVDEAAPYESVWLNPSVGRHDLRAVAIDNAGGAGVASSAVVVFDAMATPLVTLLSPPHGFFGNGPTNLLLSADAAGYGGISDVSFYNHGTNLIASVSAAPYEFLWIDATHGTDRVTAVATDVSGIQSTSAVATVTVVPPPPNLAPPTIVQIFPAPGSTVSNITTVRLRFSEAVMGLEPADLLANGVPAIGILSLGTTKVFSFPDVGVGNVTFTWAADHNIGDLGYPTYYLDTAAPEASWSYHVVDGRPPVIYDQVPARFATVLVLTNLTVTFNEPVTGVNAGDLLINGRPATGLAGGETNYTFSFPSPAPGRVNIGWAGNPGIEDLAGNVFDPAGFGTSWTYTFDNRTILVGTNAVWQFMKGLSEASTPMDAWRLPAFDASNWSNAPAPFYANDPYDTPEHPGTELTDLSGNYSSVFLRRTFELPTLNGVTNLLLRAQSDDGFVAWINGVEVLRYNMPAGEIPFDGNAAGAAPEVNGSGAGYLDYSLPVGAGLVEGSNVLTVHAFNASGGGNNQDFGFNAQLSVYIPDPAIVPPTVRQVTPAEYLIEALTMVTMEFTEPVTGVDAGDLLINGVPAASVEIENGRICRFGFEQPEYGPVTVSWVAQHGIADFDEQPRPFDSTAPGAQRSYFLINPAGPYVLSQLPPANASMTNLTELSVTFNEPVAHVDPSDLLINGVPAEGVEGEGDTYTFRFAQPAYGQVLITWAANQNITDLDLVPVPFVPVRPGDTWQYDFVDPVPPLLLTRGPYLQVGTPTSGIIRWRTDVSSDAVVRYGPTPDGLTNVIERTSMTNEHMVTLSGLEPATRYFYSIASSFRTLETGTNNWFVTSPLPGTRQPTRVWVLGDSGTANQNAAAVRDAYHDWTGTNGGKADLWLMLGDNAYNTGTDNEYQRAVFDMYTNTLRNLFLWPTIGNHETSQSTTAEEFPYLDIFTFPEQGEAGGVPSGTPKYYSFDYANIHFVCLDSMTSGRGANTPMANWLRQDLAATVQDWIIVFFHHPPYTKGSHDSDAENDLVAIRQNLVPIMESYGVDLVLSGHSHCFERSYFINGHYGLSSTFDETFMVNPGNGREEEDGPYMKDPQGKGVVYTVAGSSGQATFGDLDHPAHYISLLELGSLVIDVDGPRLDMRFLGSDSVVDDHITLLKADYEQPAAPTDLTAYESGPAEITLEWSDTSTNELGFLIERSIDGIQFEQVNDAPADAGMAVDSEVVAGVTYYYRVLAWNRDGRSEDSNIASATIFDPSSPPEAPGFLVVQADNGASYFRSQMILQWLDRSDSETGFLIERSVDGTAFEEVGTVEADMTTYLDRHLESGTYYYYRVFAFNQSASSAPSNVAGDSTHPQSLVAAEGSTVAFHAGIEGVPPIQYQWRFLNTPLFAQTNETLVLENVIYGDEGDYRVDVIDATGEITTNPAYLFVAPPPRIVSHPVDALVQAGGTAMFQVEVGGIGPFTYLWRKNGVLLETEGLAILTIDDVQAEDAGDYDVVILSDFGTLTSQAARLTVNHAPLPMPDVVYRFLDEDVAIEIASLLANDGDPDGDPVELLSVNDRSMFDGHLSTVGRYIFYVAQTNWSQPDSFDYTVTDLRGGMASTTVTIEISSNTPPAMAPMENVLASVMKPVVVYPAVQDQDVPANNLSFRLAMAPSQAVINPDTGRFLWTPARSEAASTHGVVVEVVDDGVPALSDSRSFSIQVRDYLEVTMGSTVVRSGDEDGILIELFSSAELAEVQLLVNCSLGQLEDVSFEILLPSVATVHSEPAGPDSVLVTFRAEPAEASLSMPLQARMNFRASGESAFVQVKVQEAMGVQAAGGLEPSLLLNHGRVVVVGNRSLLEATLTGQGLRQLMLYALPDRSYTIEYTHAIEEDGGWQSWQTIRPIELKTELEVDRSFAMPLFLRSRE